MWRQVGSALPAQTERVISHGHSALRQCSWRKANQAQQDKPNQTKPRFEVHGSTFLPDPLLIESQLSSKVERVWKAKKRTTGLTTVQNSRKLRRSSRGCKWDRLGDSALAQRGAGAAVDGGALPVAALDLPVGRTP